VTPTGRLLLGTSNPFGSDTGGTYRSDDDAVTWQRSGIVGQTVVAIVVDTDGSVYASAGADFRRSTDDGATWTTLATLPMGITALVRRPTGEWCIGTYTSFFPPGIGGVFSYDGVGPPVLDAGLENVSSLVVRSDGVVFAGSVGQCSNETTGDVSRSSSPGSWTHWLFSGPITALVAAEDDGIYAALDGYCGHVGSYPGKGVWSTSGPGNNWQPRNRGLVHAASYALAIAPGIVYAQAGTSLSWSEDDGTTWQSIGTGFPQDILDLVMAAHPAGDLFAASIPWVLGPSGSSKRTPSSGIAQILRTRDRGLTWEVLQMGTGYNGPLCVTASGSLLAAPDFQEGIARSSDRGDTWTLHNAVPPVESFISIQPGRLSRVFAATDSETYLSEDDGITWTRIGLAGGRQMAVAPDETSVYVLDPGPLHRLVEAPGLWGDIALTPGPVGPMVVDPRGTVYVATSTLSRLRDGETQWEEIPGTPNLSSYYIGGRPSMLFDAAGFLYVGTGNNGVLRSRVAIGSVTDVGPGTTMLSWQPGPTPFRDVTAFGLQLSRSERVTLVLFDVRGRSVSSLWNGQELGPGRHVASWRPNAGVASGSYFYRLTVGATAHTGRVTLVR
jgi:hypothetical protein